MARLEVSYTILPAYTRTIIHAAGTYKRKKKPKKNNMKCHERPEEEKNVYRKTFDGGRHKMLVVMKSSVSVPFVILCQSGDMQSTGKGYTFKLLS